MVVLRAPHHLGLDTVRLQLRLDLFRELLKRPVTRGGPIRHEAYDLLVLLRVQDCKGQVLQLPLHRRHAEAVCQRRDDVERLLRLLRLLLRWEEAHRAHIVQAVRHLNHQHARVLRHGDDHLPDRLRFCGLAQLHLVQLGHSVYQAGHLRTEVSRKVIQGVVGVLHRVVQQRRDHGGGVHADLGADRRHGKRVRDVGVAGFAEHALVQALGGPVGAVEQLDAGLRVVFPVNR